MNKFKEWVRDLVYGRKYKIEVERIGFTTHRCNDSWKPVNSGFLPSKKNKTDAGFDLIATDDVMLQAGCVIKHPLQIRMKLPKGSYAEIKSKSGLGSKGLLVYAGVIDEEYRGIPHVVATNVVTTQPIPCNATQELPMINIGRGQKLAQMVIYPYSTKYYIKEVNSVDTDTSRGVGGFGSTGK